MTGQKIDKFCEFGESKTSSAMSGKLHRLGVTCGKIPKADSRNPGQKTGKQKIKNRSVNFLCESTEAGKTEAVNKR